MGLGQRTLEAGMLRTHVYPEVSKKQNQSASLSIFKSFRIFINIFESLQNAELF